MPDGRFAEIVILAEDRTQVRFIRSWLVQHVAHNSVINRINDGGGSGEQYVRLMFPIEAELHRRRAATRSAMLIAVIDADKEDVSERYKQLLQGKTLGPGIFLFIPKRNIETWLHQLNGRAADEVTDYKPLYLKDPKSAIRTAGENFLVLVRANGPIAHTPSLARGIEEARRIPRLHKVPNP